jgi:hypothetical protein
MKQGMKRKLAPKDKHEKPSWNKRRLARADKQAAHAAASVSVVSDSGANEAATTTTTELPK